jgi:glycosyltransferase involved in cell wall biosynthesis
MRRLASGTIAYTHTDARRALEKLPDSKVWVAANALYRADQLDEPIPARDRFRVLYVGRFENQKRLHYALDAFEESGLAEQGAVLTLVGGGAEEQSLRARAELMRAPQSVEFLGWVRSVDDLRTVYAEAAVSISPGFAGLGLTQSVGFGVPMVIADGQPHSPEIEIARLPGSVSMAPGDDAKAFASALKGRWESRDEVPSEGLREYVRSHYSAEAMADGLALALADVPAPVLGFGE